MASRIIELWKQSAMMLESPKVRSRFYSSNSKVVDLKTLKPMIMKMIQNRPKAFPVVQLAHEVLKARASLYHGVSNLLHHLPVWACKYCPEVYIGERGHLIRTCGGYRRHAKIHAHEWIKATLNDILVPVESFRVCPKVIKPQESCDHNPIPAVVKLCVRAGATPSDQTAFADNMESSGSGIEVAALSNKEMKLIGKETLEAWETLRNGVKKLLPDFPVKVCKRCSIVHVGSSGNKAPLCGAHKTNPWEKAKVIDLVPSKTVWYKRPQDPPVLLHEGRDYYGRAPVVVDMCVKAGVMVPSEYFSMMKYNGSTAPV